MIISKFFEKNLIIILLGVINYCLFSISERLKESAKYASDLRICAKLKAFSINRESSMFYQQKASLVPGVEVKFVNEYCKKLTQKNIF